MDRDDARLALLQSLKERGYRFVAVTPATHARILARPFTGQPSLRDVFGWNRPFAEAEIEPAILTLMRQGDMLEARGSRLRSTLRVASLGAEAFLHSAFPTEDEDAVFFGPDTYRFVRFVRARLGGLAAQRVVDLGAGTGAGGIDLARALPGAAVTLVDSNAAALELARVNAQAAGVAVECAQGREIPSGADLVIANPPYMVDSGKRTYRDGGALHGGGISLEWAKQALDRLAPGGTMLLYTGAAVTGGEAELVTAIREACAKAGAAVAIEEIDPDVFGEELDGPAYADVERIAAIGAVIREP